MSSKIDSQKVHEQLSAKSAFGSVRRQQSIVNNFGLSGSIALLKAEEEKEKEKESITIIERIERFRLNLKKFMTNSTFGRVYQNMLLVLSIFSCLQYIYTTYIKQSQSVELVTVFDLIEKCLAGLFSWDWALSFFLADHKLTHVTSFFSMVDLLTVIPIWITYGRTCPIVDDITTVKDAVLYFLFGLGTTRILRALRIQRKLNLVEDAVDRCFGEICLVISVMVLFNSALMQFLEQTMQPLDFHTWMYWNWVTTATVGYGDISPKTVLGRFAVMGMICFAIIVVPQMTNKLIDLMAAQSIYARLYYRPKSEKSQHVLICGELKSTSLREFFDELFHEDHENVDLTAVILQPEPPSREMFLMLRDPHFEMFVTYLEGSALVEKDLLRAQASTAVAIFIMTNKFSEDADEEDAKTILQHLSIKRYAESSMQQAPRNQLYCMQLIRPENQRHLPTRTNSSSTNLVICLNEIKMGVLAKAVMFPGANTLLMNLMSSFAGGDDDDEGESEDKDKVISLNDPDPEPRKSFLHRLSFTQQGAAEKAKYAANEQKSSKEEWLKEYEQGCDWEIYTTNLSHMFGGIKFVELSYTLYQKLGILLFALQVTDVRKGITKVMLNPAEYVIPRLEDGDWRVQAFVIARDKGESDLEFDGTGHNEDLNFLTAFQKITKLNSHNEHSASGSGSKEASGVERVSSSNAQMPPTFPSGDTRRESGNGSFIITGGGGGGGGGGRGPRRGSVSAAIVGAIGAVSGTAATAATSTTSSSASDQPAPKKRNLWDLLKRRNLMKKKVELDSAQEKLQKAEDQHMVETYYLRGAPVELSECLVKTSVVEEVPHINNHLIIMGKGMGNLYDLIRPLRAKYLGSLKYIVILYPGDMPDAVWRRINIFEAILVVRGSPLEENDLRRAGIFRASQVVLVADVQAQSQSTPGAQSAASEQAQESLVDSDAIFSYQCVKRLNPSTQVVVEMVHHGNIGYLDSDNASAFSKEEYKFSPQFASGSLFTTSLLDTLVCQAFYNPNIVKIIDKLVSGVDAFDRAERLEHITRTMEAEGLLDGAAPQEKEDDGGSDSDSSSASGSGSESAGEAADDVKSLKPAVKNNDKKRNSILKRIESPLHSVLGSALYLIPVPDDLTIRTYGSLFKNLARKNIIPLGLLRGVFSGMSLGPKSNKMPYVFTNPNKEAEVFVCDKVFVLSTTPLQCFKLSVKDWLANIQMRKQLDGSKGLKKEDPQTALQKDFVGLERAQKNLEYKFDRLAADMRKKFELIFLKLGGDISELPVDEEKTVITRSGVQSAKGTRSDNFENSNRSKAEEFKPSTKLEGAVVDAIERRHPDVNESATNETVTNASITRQHTVLVPTRASHEYGDQNGEDSSEVEYESEEEGAELVHPSAAGQAGAATEGGQRERETVQQDAVADVRSRTASHDSFDMIDHEIQMSARRRGSYRRERLGSTSAMSDITLGESFDEECGLPSSRRASMSKNVLSSLLDPAGRPESPVQSPAPMGQRRPSKGSSIIPAVDLDSPMSVQSSSPFGQRRPSRGSAGSLPVDLDSPVVKPPRRKSAAGGGVSFAPVPVTSAAAPNLQRVSPMMMEGAGDDTVNVAAESLWAPVSAPAPGGSTRLAGVQEAARADDESVTVTLAPKMDENDCGETFRGENPSRAGATLEMKPLQGAQGGAKAAGARGASAPVAGRSGIKHASSTPPQDRSVAKQQQQEAGGPSRVVTTSVAGKVFGPPAELIATSPSRAARIRPKSAAAQQDDTTEMMPQRQQQQQQLDGSGGGGSSPGNFQPGSGMRSEGGRNRNTSPAFPTWADQVYVSPLEEYLSGKSPGQLLPVKVNVSDGPSSSSAASSSHSANSYK